MSDNRDKQFWSRLGRLNLPAQAALLAAFVAIVWLMMAPIAYQVSALSGLIAAATGSLVCLLGAELALIIPSFFRGSSTAVYGMLIGMLARAFLPLLLGVVLHREVPALAAAGMVYYLLVCYLGTLTAETALMLAQIRNNSSSPKAIS
jgi:peptidoglycan/LPS O-acetylase OafA/YrhL